jgi:hypothetical protein
MHDALALSKGGSKTKRTAEDMSAVSCPLWTCGMVTQTAWQGSNAEEHVQYDDDDDYDGIVSHGCKRQDRGMTPPWDDLVAFANQRRLGTVGSVTDDLGSLWMEARAGDLLFAGMLLSVG